jgi:glycerol uptake facilitator-like aquaporin
MASTFLCFMFRETSFRFLNVSLSLSLARARAVLPGFAFSLSAAAAAAALSCRSVLGFTVVVGACSGGPVSGGAFNPAVGFG